MGKVLELKEEFLENNPDYTNDINNFVDYINVNDGKNVFDKEFTIGGMTISYILNSLQFNINNERIKSKETAKKYLTSVGMLIDYILDNSDIKNISLRNQLGAPARRNDSYAKQCNNFIDTCEQLREKEIYQALDNAMADKLIEWADLQINNASSASDILNQPVLFRRMSAALCVKLMLLTGITYRCARKLNLDCLNLRVNTITINNYKIRLPIKFSEQLMKYVEIRNENGINGKALFINSTGERWTKQNSSSCIPDYFKTDNLKTTPTGIIKYGIKELISVGVNQAVISELTEASSSIIEDCLPKSENEDGWYAYLNSKIVNTRIYEQL